MDLAFLFLQYDFLQRVAYYIKINIDVKRKITDFYKNLLRVSYRTGWFKNPAEMLKCASFGKCRKSANTMVLRSLKQFCDQ